MAERASFAVDDTVDHDLLLEALLNGDVEDVGLVCFLLLGAALHRIL